MRLIDAIVPVYDVEAYLEACVDSLLGQDFDLGYGIILVDDGSPDGCPAICDRYAEAYPDLVRVIHKENGGLSDARNAGVAASEAAYVCFVDSDDRVAKKHLSSLYAALAQTGADMAACPVRRAHPLPDGGFRYELPAAAPAVCMDRDEALRELCYERFFPGYAVCKLVPRKIAAAHPFPVGRIFEDTGTVYRYVMDCASVAYTPEPTYDYLQREGSILRRRFEDKHLDQVLLAARMEEVFREAGLPKSVQAAAAYRLCRACYTTVYHAAATLPSGEYLDAYRKILPYYRRALPTALEQPAADAWRRTMFRVALRPRLMYALVRLKER